MRGSYRAILFGCRLSVAIIEIAKIEPCFFGPDLHVFERVSDIAVTQLIQPDRRRIAGADGHDTHSFGGVVPGHGNDPLFIGLRSRAMVAHEYYYQYFGIFK